MIFCAAKLELLQLKSRLESKEDITISPQALDQRFNEKSVEFLKAIFYEMLKKQNEVLRDEQTLLKYHFKAIKVVDSTTIILPEHLVTTYRGSGGSASIAAVKVQLQLDLLTGNFIKCDISEAVSNDADYLPVLKKSIEKKRFAFTGSRLFSFRPLRYLRRLRSLLYFKNKKYISNLY